MSQSSAGVGEKRLLTCPRLLNDEMVATVNASYVESGFATRYVQWLQEEMVFAFTKLSVLTWRPTGTRRTKMLPG